MPQHGNVNRKKNKESISSAPDLQIRQESDFKLALDEETTMETRSRYYWDEIDFKPHVVVLNFC